MVPGSEALLIEGREGRSVSVTRLQFGGGARSRDKSQGKGRSSTHYAKEYSQRVGGADDLASGLHHLLAFPDHAHHGA